MGKETELDVPTLPQTIAQGFGGYHSDRISQESHNLFKEIPSLGIAGGMLMAAASADEEPEPVFRIGTPTGSEITENLTGYFPVIGPRLIEIRQRLQSQGITPNAFPEYVTGTRFNLRYMLSVSDTLGKFETFRNEKVCFSRNTISGGESQIIVTRPQDDKGLDQRWTETTVQATSAGCESTTQIGASYVFGFQLHKEDGQGQTLTARSQRWSCLRTNPEAEVPWHMPAA
jgi:hypothetical protein